MIKKITSALYSRTIKKINSHRGWKTNRKIVVIESDDWGSIRMPSKEIYKANLRNGYRVDNNFYEKFDSLESEDDLNFLCETLLNFKDCFGNPCKVTTNVMVANPDFEKIKKENFQSYHYEEVGKTFSSYPKHSNCLKLWKLGEKENVFKIQYHGREHLNVSLFMSDLQQNADAAVWAFNNKMLGSINKKENSKNFYVEATKPSNKEDSVEKGKILLEGLDIFKKIMEKDSKSFIAPNYRWHSDYNLSLFKKGVKYLQGNYFQLQSKESDNGTDDKIPHFLGEQNKIGQIYLVRNCIFEPTLMPHIDALNYCLSQVDKAFAMNRPAIICSHRVNYIGFIHEYNRDRNLKKLEILIKCIQKKWPDVEFLSSDQVGDLITV